MALNLGLDELLLDIFGQAQRKLLGKRIRLKLRQRGVKLTTIAGKRLKAWENGAEPGDWTWLDSLAPDFELEEKDWSEVNAAVDELHATIPNLIERSAESAAGPILSSVRRDWKRRGWEQQAETTHFRERLRGRWSNAFDELALLRTISREVGDELISRHRRSRSRKGRIRQDLLIRLHLRGCLVADEIQALMEAGYANGALARWRTLHEINVVASVLANGDDDLASQYLLHENVEAKTAMDEYVKNHRALGFKPPSPAETRAVDERYDEMLKLYGREFGGPYGWAAKHLGERKPTFASLQAAAGREMMKSFYKMASYPVHAGVKGITWNLALPAGERGTSAAATNAGLEEPGQNMAISLVALTALLVSTGSIDDAVILMVLGKQRDRAVAALMRAGRKLTKEHRQSAPPDAKRARRHDP